MPFLLLLLTLAFLPSQASPAAAFSLDLLVHDESGRGVEGAQVTVVSGSDPLTVTTDSRGRSTVSNLRAGRYRVLPSKQGFLLNVSVGQQLPGEAGIWVSLPGTTQSRLVDLVMAKEGMISGRIVDPKGSPRPNVSVSVGRITYDDNPQQCVDYRKSRATMGIHASPGRSRSVDVLHRRSHIRFHNCDIRKYNHANG
jgi:hypothetical protein